MYGWDRYRGSVWDSMKTIWRTEGPRGFFRGNSATVVRIMPYAAIQYSSFEFFNRILSTYVFSPDSTSPAKRFIAGAMAGTTSVLCTYPIDLARTVLAVQVGSRSRAEARGYGLFGTLTSIAREQGISSMYRGMYPTIVGVVPYAGISFLTYGVLRRNADRLGVSERAPLFTSLVCGGSAGLGLFFALHTDELGFLACRRHVADSSRLCAPLLCFVFSCVCCSCSVLHLSV